MGLSFTYDGFGSRTAQAVTKGSGPAWSQVVDPQTNRVTGTGYGYDAAGRKTVLYDEVGRVESVSVSGVGTEIYEYSPSGDRIYRDLAGPARQYTFYGALGENLGKYAEGSGAEVSRNVYFAGKPLELEGEAVVTERLGSVVLRHESEYPSGWKRLSAYPYGEAKGAPGNADQTAFATYHRDSTTGLDYARQRYYSSLDGRFTSPDPYRASGGPGDPGSWNRYAYVGGDPVNWLDPMGLFAEGVPANPNQQLLDLLWAQYTNAYELYLWEQFNDENLELSPTLDDDVRHTTLKFRGWAADALLHFSEECRRHLDSQGGRFAKMVESLNSVRFADVHESRQANATLSELGLAVRDGNVTLSEFMTPKEGFSLHTGHVQGTEWILIGPDFELYKQGFRYTPEHMNELYGTFDS